MSWLEGHPLWQLHYADARLAVHPNRSSRFLPGALLLRGIFTSKTDLKTQLVAFIERYNPAAKPFAWTYERKPIAA